jgi:hypothetical protein
MSAGFFQLSKNKPEPLWLQLKLVKQASAKQRCKETLVVHTGFPSAVITATANQLVFYLLRTHSSI